MFRTDADMIAKISQFRAWLASADAMAEKYSAPPSAIDFASYKEKIRSKDLVENLEKFYSSASPRAEKHEWTKDDQEAKAKLIEDAELEREKVLADIKYYKDRYAVLQANRTTRDTTAAQLREIYPDIAKEIDEEIDNREWFKDVVDGCRSPINTQKHRKMLKDRYPDQAEEIDRRFDAAFPSK